MDFHVRESLRCMPRYFALVVELIFWPFTQRLRCLVIILSLVLKIIIPVLLTFSDILLLQQTNKNQGKNKQVKSGNNST